MATLQPLADRVLVKPIEKEEKTKSGIYLPDTAKEKPQEGKVLAVGPGKMSDDGKRIEMDVKVGDTVIYAKYGGTEIKVDDEGSHDSPRERYSGEEITLLRECKEEVLHGKNK